MVFHEITKAAIQEAAANPRDLDMDLVEAQETRRILDRLYGYEVSPVLWRKVMSGLSAGRVQSVATRLVVDREKERMAFRVASYWDLEGTFRRRLEARQRMFPAKLYSIDGTRVASRRNFGPDGQLKERAARRPPRPDPCRGAGGGARRHVVRRPLGRGQALQAVAVPAVPHHDPPAGGQPQARDGREHDHVGRAAPLRERLHHLHAHRLDHAVRQRRRRGPVAGAGAVRRGVPPRLPADLHQQGQERPGGARGDPARRRVVPHAGADRPDRRPVPALRADLDAHRRVADEGRGRPVGLGPASAAGVGGQGRTSSSPRPAG